MTRRSLYWERDGWEEPKTHSLAVDDHCCWLLASGHFLLALFYHLWTLYPCVLCQVMASHLDHFLVLPLETSVHGVDFRNLLDRPENTQC